MMQRLLPMGLLAALLGTGCSNTVSLGHGELNVGGAMGAAASNGGVAVGGAAATGGADFGTIGCAHRSDSFLPTTSFAGHVWSATGSAPFRKVAFLFDQLDAGRVSGRVIFDTGESSYAELEESVPSRSGDPRSGFEYTIVSGSLVGATLDLEIALSEPWCAVCGEQTSYPAGSSYACVPRDQAFRCVDSAQCDAYFAVDPVTGVEQRFSAYQVQQLCTSSGPCGCTKPGCGACGFSRSEGCEPSKLSFYLLLSSTTISGTVFDGTTSLYVNTEIEKAGMVELVPDRLAAIEAAACGVPGTVPDATVSACEVALPAVEYPFVLSLDETSVIYTRSDGAQFLVVQTADPDCQFGWRYSDAQDWILLCSSTCDLLLSDPKAAIWVHYGCLAPTVS